MVFYKLRFFCLLKAQPNHKMTASTALDQMIIEQKLL